MCVHMEYAFIGILTCKHSVSSIFLSLTSVSKITNKKQNIDFIRNFYNRFSNLFTSLLLK